MAKLDRDEISRIIERDIPGASVLEGESIGDFGEVVPADVDTPDIDTLRAKFLGADATPSTSDDELEAVPITYGNDDASSTRTAIVSTNQRKVIGAQG